MTYPDDAKAGGRIIVQIHPRMKDIVPEFLKNSQKDVTALREAINQSDYATIVRMGHNIKGSCGFGIDHLAEIGKCLESAGKDQDIATVRRWVDEMEDYLNRVDPVCETS